LNDEVLAAGASHWEDWRQFDPTRIDTPAALALKARAKSALAGEFGDAILAVVKDPRMCRLMPFWSSVFREADWSVSPSFATEIDARSRLIARSPRRNPAGRGPSSKICYVKNVPVAL